MQGIDHIFNGLSYLSYAICIADGSIQDLELKKLEKDVAELGLEFGAQVTFITSAFKLLAQEKPSGKTALNIGTIELSEHNYYLDDDLKSKLFQFCESLAAANPPITEEEKIALEKIKETLYK